VAWSVAVAASPITTAPLAGKADAPDIPASPMPAAIRPTNIIVRIVMSPSVFAVFDHPFVRSQSALPQVRVFADVVLPRTVFFKRYSSANAIMHIMFACNLAFSTSQALIWRSFIYCSLI
jgi:hypothetical protein